MNFKEMTYLTKKNKNKIFQNKKLNIFLFVYLLFLSSFLFAGEGVTSGILMERNFGSRPASLTAFTAITGGIDSFDYNPAGIFNNFKNEIKTQFINGIVDSNYLSFGFVRGLNSNITSQKKKEKIVISNSSISISFKYFNAGNIFLSDLQDNISKNVNAETDKLISLGYSKAFFQRQLLFGLIVKYLNSNLIEKYNGNAYAFDMGMIYNSNILKLNLKRKKIVSNGLKLGVSARNFGSSIKYDQEAEALPSELRFGCSYDILLQEINSFIINIDSIMRLKKDINFGFGLEYKYQSFFIRSGYKISKNINSLNIGIGFIIKFISLDFNYSPTEKFDGLYNVTFGAGF